MGHDLILNQGKNAQNLPRFDRKWSKNGWKLTDLILKSPQIYSKIVQNYIKLSKFSLKWI